MTINDNDDDMGRSRNFREYAVWKDAVAYATFVYEATSKMPWLTSLTFLTRLDKVQTSLTLCSLLQKFEKKGLSDQLQRAVISISSNIAEGSARPTDADFAHFLDIALGSAFEVETQLVIAKSIGYLDENQYQELITKLSSVERQLNGLINTIRNS